jgi:hypothetical protein
MTPLSARRRLASGWLNDNSGGGMMQEEREPIGSNIYDAISFMTKELERREAMIDDSVARVFKGLSLGQWWLIVWGITLLWVFIHYHLVHGLNVLGAFLFPIWLPLAFGYFSFYFGGENLRARETLVRILPDLKKLYEYDPNMDVGFQLLQIKSDTWFDEPLLKAMMKKREKEIRRQNPSPETSEQQDLQTEADKYRAEVERLKKELEARNK